MSDSTFDNLSDALNTDFVEDETVSVESKIEKYEEVKNKALDICNAKESNLEDKEYLRMELKSLISTGLVILDKLEQDISIGTHVRSHEVYFGGMNSIMNALKELRDLNKTEVELDIAKTKAKKSGGAKNVTNNIFTGKDLLKMINTAQSDNSLNEVKAEFNIEDKQSESFRDKKLKDK